MSKLASIETIIETVSHPNADSLDLVKVLGWTCVSNKDNGFKVGDRVVYIRTDTKVEDRPEYEFLRNKNFRVKPIRLRGIMSEGLLVPCDERCAGLEVGADVSEIYGVTKYEKPIPACLSGTVKSVTLPYGLSITDEERCQNYPALIAELLGQEAAISVKCDGSSSTFIWRDQQFEVCSRKLSLLEDKNNTFWRMAEKYDLQKKLEGLGQNLIIRGEVCGPGIQDNKMGLPEHDLFVYDVLDGDTLRPLDFEDRMIWVQALGLRSVPILWRGVFNMSMAELEDMAENLKYDNGRPAEGIVVRPQEEMHSYCMNSRLSFKVVSKRYGLKE